MQIAVDKSIYTSVNILLTKDIWERCLIQPGCLDIALARSYSACEAHSLEQLKSFLHEHDILRSYEIFTKRYILERAVLVATQILGSDCYLTQEQLEQKAKYHLLMSVNMTLNWLLDDTFDVIFNIQQDFIAEVIQFYTAVFESETDVNSWMQSLQTASYRNGISESFIETLFLLLQWQRSLAQSLGVPTEHSSLSARITQDFLATYLKNRDDFDSWRGYEDYRCANCGLPIEILYSAYWLCHLWGIDASVIEQHQEKYLSFLYRYSLIGGVSNDLFGYEKDLSESVATSVEVAKAYLPVSSDNSEELTHKAFLQVIEFHNQRLTELVDRIYTCESQTEMTILFSALTTAWSIRILHEFFMKIYQPNWLRKVLSRGSHGVTSTPKPSQLGVENPEVGEKIKKFLDNDNHYLGRGGGPPPFPILVD